LSEKELLLVEDSKTQVVLMRRLLEESGLQVTVVNSGKDALDWLDENPPRPVLTDVTMPEINGYELCSRIKKSSRLEATPVILLASLREPGDLTQILESGADGFIYKEFESSYFIPMLNEILNVSRQATCEAPLALFKTGKSSIPISSSQAEGIMISAFNTAVYCRSKLEALL